MEIVVPVLESGQPIGLSGFARPEPERAEELLDLLLSFVGPTRAEPGSLVYQVHRDAADPARLVFYELWRSPEDLRQHLALPHMAEFQRTRMEYLDEDLEIHWLRPMEVADRGEGPSGLTFGGSRR
jgi:quinol monooxygenase YgiN